MAAVETTLGQARAAGRPSLVTYVTGGIRADWTDLLTAMIDAGADAVEIGLPFSDPMLDGPVIQRASGAALARGATPAGILAQLERVDSGGVPLIAMAYANHAYRHGLGRYCRQLAGAGIAGTIIPDLPAAEAGDYLDAAPRRRPRRHPDGHPRHARARHGGDRRALSRFPLRHECHGHDRNHQRERRRPSAGPSPPAPAATAPGRC